MSQLQRGCLADYRDLHCGATILVCGCGASLALLERPERFLTIGVNDVGRRFTPDYLVVVNERRQFQRDRFVHVERTQAKAVFTQLEHLALSQTRVVSFRLGRRGGTDRADAESLHYSNNSPYVAVNLARYLGAQRIGLIGVDFSDDHFFGATGRHPLAGQLPQIDREYGALAEACRAEGIELVNLSPLSRLQSLPRARLASNGTWAALISDAAPPATTGTRRPPMKVAIESRPSSGAIGQLLDALAESARALGHAVTRDSARGARPPHALSIVWNGRSLAGRGPILYCEHGWLPRSDYQISPRGINACSHAAPFEWDGRPLTGDEGAALDAHLARVKAATHHGPYQYMQAVGDVPAQLPEDFLLVPLQMESDTNILRHAPAQLRTMRALIEHVSRLDPPWPVIFKQHPADARRANAQLKLRVCRPQDRVWPHALGTVHQVLKSGACRGIVTINSNVAHDGLLWDVPAIVLGRNIWPTSGAPKPFLTAAPRDWWRLAESVTSAEAVACRRAYAHHLVRHQWTLTDARNPQRVAALIELAWREHALPAPAQIGPRGAAPARRAPAPVINVVCENRGWLFESWKHAFAAAGRPGFRVLASPRPVRSAAAWIFIRATEAAGAPDPKRSVAQLHDLADDGSYRSGGARAGVAHCAALSLTHPAQQALLEGQGIALAQRRWLLQPVGWQSSAPIDVALQSRASVAWVGRPARRAGAEVSGLDVFTRAARHWAELAEVVLIGERLEGAAAELKEAGVACRRLGLAQCPLHRAPHWLSRFDVVVLTSAADAGPWPIFDALHAGVPVVALPVGRAESLLADGECGRLVGNADELAEAVAAVLTDRAGWRRRRALVRERVARQSFDAWLSANLDLAAELAHAER